MQSKLSVNIPVVARMMGWLLLIESVFLLAPLAAALIYGEVTDMKAFAVTVAATFLCAAMMLSIKPKSTQMSFKDGFLLTSMVWFVFSLFGTIPFLLTGSVETFADAYFESISGFTTTGSTVIRDVESLSHAILLWRSVMQWIGGMGIILFTLAVTPMLNRNSGVQLFNAEVTGITDTRIRPRVGNTAKSLWGMYGAFTFVSFILLWIGPMNCFDALCHTLSGVSTGGFSTKNNSVAYWDSEYLHLVLILIMFIGGVNFPFMYRVAKGDFKLLRTNEPFRAYLDMTVFSAAVIGISVFLNGFSPNLYQSVKFGIFKTIAAMTSTGYSIGSYEEAGPVATVMVFFLMLFGAMAGSTSGGAKIDRFAMLLKVVKNELHLILHPLIVKTPRYNDKPLDKPAVSKLLAFMTVYSLIFSASTVVLVCFGLPVYDSMFTALESLSNIGLGHGVTGGNFAALPELCKYFLGFIMVVGRLEIFTVILLFTKSFWIK
ncbi:MAG: TrkH family potassium uptake protein [Muribaculaceae bacterium]|nr:TrkH family potassium uptake protein [Muribaculaceae bacterium]